MQREHKWLGIVVQNDGACSFIVTLNKISHCHQPTLSFCNAAIHDLACKAAIKANDKNSIPELQQLAEDVYYNENIRHCPHGRPVMFVLSKRDIEKQFKRIQ